MLEGGAGEGGDLARWAREHGIDGRSLNAWRINLERRTTPRRGSASRTAAAPLQLVELVPAAMSARTAARFVLRIGGAELEVGDGFCEETLARIVRVLRSC